MRRLHRPRGGPRAASPDAMAFAEALDVIGLDGVAIDEVDENGEPRRVLRAGPPRRPTVAASHRPPDSLALVEFPDAG